MENSRDNFIKRISHPSDEEARNVYIKYVNDQINGYFATIDLIKEQLEIMIQNGKIDKEIELFARIKGIKSAIVNDVKNGKQLDDVFGITIISKNGEDKKEIINQLFNALIMPIQKRCKNVHKPKKINGEEVPGYDAYHAIGRLNYEQYDEMAQGIKIAKYLKQIEKILTESEREEISDFINTDYSKLEMDNIPFVEIIFQTREEYERAQTIASHTKYKESLGLENAVDIQQRFFHGQLHRFVDVPLMFHWNPKHDSKLMLLTKKETCYKMYPYLETLSDVHGLNENKEKGK